MRDEPCATCKAMFYEPQGGCDQALAFCRALDRARERLWFEPSPGSPDDLRRKHEEFNPS